MCAIGDSGGSKLVLVIEQCKGGVLHPDSCEFLTTAPRVTAKGVTLRTMSGNPLLRAKEALVLSEQVSGSVQKNHSLTMLHTTH